MPVPTGGGGAAGTRLLMDPNEHLIVICILSHSHLRYGNMFDQSVYQAILD